MNGQDKPESNQKVIITVVATLCVDATIGISTLAYCMVFQKEMNTALLTAFVAIVNYVLGVISGMLAKTSATPTSPALVPKPLSTDPPAPVEIKQPVGSPVPVVETPKQP